MSKLWEPIRIGTMELKNRFIMAPMFTCLANPGGQVSDEIVQYYERRAKGGAAMIIVEIAAVHPQGAISDRELLLTDDRYIPGMARIAEAIKKHNCKAVLQLHHPGRQADSKVTGFPTVGPSPVPWASFSDMPRELTLAEVKELVQCYAEAARRTREAGFDGVEFHGAHGYLICQFFSPLSNKRTDEYGGDVYKRAKFGVDIMKLARQKLGREYPILFRISGSEIEEGGLTTDETRIIARLLQEAGADCIDVSAGYYGTSEWVSQPAFMKPGCIVKYATEIKREVSVPVITVGRINQPHLAETILEENNADLVALGRPLLADPDYPLKAKEGKPQNIVKCIACNTCMDLVFLRKHITCVQNPYAGYEREEGNEGKVQNPRKVLVIGEGPAAMEAARVAGLRGHETVFWRTKGQPGGHWTWLIHAFVTDKLKAVKAAGAKIEKKDEVNLNMVKKLSPAVVMVEQGVRPSVPTIPGVNGKKVMQAVDVLSGSQELKGKVVIIGGGNLGVQTALQLGKKALDITIIEERRGPAFEVEQISRKLLMQKLVARKVQMLFQCKVTAIDGNGVIYLAKDGKESRVNADHIVLALGMEPDLKLLESIKQEGYPTVPLEYCSAQRSVYDFVRQGALAARKV
ncbi:MAG: FAD-dependent oxidoreductase [Candidatus Tectomicrobia bacterium]|uniref:FAD-dependent oxidoreductase n=1 Tax=Tectimicrobiota bacterium TaxID=2528274 RepID=A0A933GKX0_UNCTE|nr:FAD-dependent oxidoreductase [Candidatus Tectomicrobia bacterium]